MFQYTEESPPLIPPVLSNQAYSSETPSLPSENENPESIHSMLTYKKPFPVLPIVKQTLPRDDIIKQGVVLCTRIEEWYKKTSKDNVDVRLRKRKQRWRQFKAVLTKDRLELYHITSTRMKRVAHRIELDSKYGQLKLSIISPIDYIWELELLRTKRPVVYHFQSSHLSDAQDWYMTLYQLLPKTRMIRKIPSPPFIDLIIPELDHFVVHIPLHTLSDYQKKSSSTIYNIRMHDLKLAALHLLEYRNIKPSGWSFKNVSLCWTLDSHTEWVTDKQNTLLIGPQLVEQKYKLELRHLKDQRISHLTEPCLDGMLKPWQWDDKQQVAVDQKKSKIYAILAGHFLFLIDASQYPDQIGKVSPKKSWFYSTNDLLQKEKKQKKEKIRHSVQSAPTPVVSIREPEKSFSLIYAKQILDILNIEAVDIAHYSNNIFKIHVKGGYTLCYQADTMQNMLEWIQILVKKQQQQNDDHHSHISAALKTELNVWYSFYQSHQVVKTGILYVKSNKLFNKMLCILTNGNELLIYDMFKRKKWNGQSVSVPLYDQKYNLKLGSNVYVYSGSECLSDQQQIVKRQQIEPACLFNDGLVTEKMKPSDCYFVIWSKRNQTRFTYTRDCISLFKTGHSLGSSGHYLVFKTRNKVEKNSWVWALHKEYGVNAF